jgi:hypothetical protein
VLRIPIHEFYEHRHAFWDSRRRTDFLLRDWTVVLSPDVIPTEITAFLRSAARTFPARRYAFTSHTGRPSDSCRSDESKFVLSSDSRSGSGDDGEAAMAFGAIGTGLRFPLYFPKGTVDWGECFRILQDEAVIEGRRCSEGI